MLDADRGRRPAHAEGTAAVMPAPDDRDGYRARYGAVRSVTERLAAPLSAEDMTVQSRTECSPTKWHLGHVSWFFETFILRAVFPRRPPFRPDFPYIFNSYYEGAGPRQPRPQRGMLTRPPLDEVYAYRAAVDEAMDRLIAIADDDVWPRIRPMLDLGLAHEQQHQELILMDILDLFALSPLAPAYRPDPAPAETVPPALPPLHWHDHPGGIVEIGHDPADGFAFDNEGPRHQTLLHPFRLADRCVTNGEWLAFMADGGYERPDLWLMDGWAAVQARGWTAPRYWRPDGGNGWKVFGLTGLRPLDPVAPVTHVSFYEADAYARWAGARLPTEAEWEAVAATRPVAGGLLGSPETAPLAPRPAPVAEEGGPAQMFGDVWEWTASPYRPYPGFTPPPGVVGEYNGKFMCNQMVLRGGSCVTPEGHIRPTYRNFFYPHDRWAFSGVRLAEDA